MLPRAFNFRMRGSTRGLSFSETPGIAIAFSETSLSFFIESPRTDEIDFRASGGSLDARELSESTLVEISLSLGIAASADAGSVIFAKESVRLVTAPLRSSPTLAVP